MGEPAYELHQSVPADRWCVTFWDLAFLRQEVKTALGSGQIQPGPDEDASEAYGPSIYTVTEQYIKPVTWKAGKMSWALMRNPDGLKCDLFISHAWQEGVFEFLSKVKHSWPRQVKTAWCCMLANPQNLDIASFLQSPTTSPFAIALRAADVMLVVPNRHQSVYTRLWCAYEAYLAQEEGKTILIAKSSNLHLIWRSMLWMALAAVSGALLGIWVSFPGNRAAAFGALSLCLVANSNLFRRVMHLLGHALVWTQVVQYFDVKVDDAYLRAMYRRDPGVPNELMGALDVGYWLMVSATFCVMEMDRINALLMVSEAQELSKGYEGSIQYAKCSQQADADSIRAEIGDQVHRVDLAIHVLLTAGMSTPALRDIARSVDIRHAAFSEIAGAAFLLGPCDLLVVSTTLLDLFYGVGARYSAVFPIISLLARSVLFILLLRRRWDEQSFILKVMNKGVFCAMLCFIVLAVPYVCKVPKRPLIFSWLLITDLIVLFMMCLALLGIRGTARLPCGLSVLGVVFSRGRNALEAVCAGPDTSEDSTPLTDTDRSSPSLSPSSGISSGVSRT